MAKNYWGFDIKNIDKTVRPQDDFYRYANGNWLKKAKIPANESRWGAFTILRYKTDHQLRVLIKKILKIKAPKGSSAQLVRDLYKAASNMALRNKLGIGPVAPLRLFVHDIQSKTQIEDTLACLQKLGISGFFGSLVDQDSKNSERYILHLWQGGLGMPDRDYYLLDKPEQKRVREAYREHIRRLLKLFNFTKDDITATEAAVMKIETVLAKASMRKEDIRDPEKVYHKYSVAQLKKLAPAFDWARYLTKKHARGIQEVIVGQPHFFKALNTLVDNTSLEELKRYMEWHALNDSAGMLSMPFVREQFNFYTTVLTGQKKMRPLWRRALGAVSAAGEALGKLYVQEYFPPSSKKAIDELVSDLFTVYEERIKKLDWMGSPTKRKAIKKLRRMSRKIGYPKKWEKYKGLFIDPEDHFGNMLRAEEWWHIKNTRKLKRGIDRNEWFMTPQTVNAYFAPNLNDIVFPAAILQWPFFDPKADAAVNYAGIGSVIGHEMTHGFDDQGAKFDGKGNMVQWWSPSDKRKFEKKSRVAVQQYNKYQVADGVMVNGRLTLGENIADFGGLAIAWDAYQKHLHKTERKTIQGLSPEKRFFFGFAQMELELTRPEHKKMAALTDPHSPAETRINGPLSNFEPFYKLFGVKKGDKLYRDKKICSTIW